MMIKVIFAAMISATLVAALPQDRAQAQAAAQQDTKEARAKEEKAQAKEERAKKKSAAREARKKAREERLKAAENRSATHRQAVEAQHQKMGSCETKWLEHKKSTNNTSRKAYYAFMKTCQSQ
jgi:uncharacterized protein HemX